MQTLVFQPLVHSHVNMGLNFYQLSRFAIIYHTNEQNGASLVAQW